MLNGWVISTIKTKNLTKFFWIFKPVGIILYNNNNLKSSELNRIAKIFN